MHSLDGEYAPPDDAIEPSLCASCIFGAVVIVRVRGDEDTEPTWHTRSYCRASTIAGANVTLELPEPVHACTEYVPDPKQEAP